MVECLVHPRPALVPDEVLERARALATSLISDVFGRSAGASGVLPVAGLPPGQVVAGTALTVRTRPGDNLVVHKALDLGRTGDVLVVGAGGGTDRAILGGLLGHYASTKGFAALVVDGAVRDRSELDKQAPPVFARGLSHLGPYKDGPGELHCPVSASGLVIQDGDLIVADEDGITAVPRARVDEIITAAEQKRQSERAQNAAIAEGTWDRSWIDSALDLRHVGAGAHDEPAVPRLGLAGD